MKSLLTFGHRIGYLPFDVGRPLRLPTVKDTLSERILDEAEHLRMIALEPSPRNHALLRVLYSCGLRISAAGGVKCPDAKGTRKGGQLTVFGKGGKTRFVIVPLKLWKQVTALKGEAGPDDPISRSRENGPACRPRLPSIGCATPMRATPWIAARQCMSSSSRWATAA